MNLYTLLVDDRTWIAATLVGMMIGTYFYLESVVGHVEDLRKDFDHAQQMEDREDAQWLDEEMRHLTRHSAEHAELRRMILDACKE